MKTKITLIICWFLVTFNTLAQQPFITTWANVNNVGSIGFTATTTGSVAYSWTSVTPNTAQSGSGTFISGNVIIPIGTQINTIRLTIQPENFKRILVNPSSCAITEINQWGSVEWSSMENAFSNENSFFTTGLQQVTATDIPNLTNVTNMSNMFAGSSSLNSPFNINAWNISNVTDISGMFKNCANFNQALSLWNTSNVTNMTSLFQNATFFNQNISNWNTSNVTSMSKMFKDAYAFNRNINTWNVINVTNMSEMFNCNIGSALTPAYNQPLGNWNVTNVTNMGGMFKGALSFNQNIGNWNTSNVTDMSDMFNQAFSFNQNIGNWNTSNVTTMARMFRSDFVFFTPTFATTSLFNNGGSSSIQNWNTANVTDMSGIFFRAENFNHNFSNWALNANVNLQEMLDRSGLSCKNYTLTIIGWNNNPTTPNNKILGATFMNYGPEAVTAINNLVVNKGWGFSGHDFISVTPEFDFNTTYCAGASIPALPSISEDGIQGTWLPALNSSTTTTYTFIPNEGQCATTTTATITINTIPNLTGETSQSFSGDSTLSNLVISPSNVLWYATAEDALANLNPLPTTTTLQNGFTYFAVNDNGTCRSQPFPVTVSINLSTTEDDFLSFKYHPNPVRSILTIAADSNIKNVVIYNLLGQVMINQTFNDTTISINLEDLPKSVYIVQAKSDNASKQFRIIRE